MPRWIGNGTEPASARGAQQPRWEPPGPRYVEDGEGRQQRVYACGVCRDEGYISLPPPPPTVAEWDAVDAYNGGLPDNEYGRGLHCYCPACRPHDAQFVADGRYERKHRGAVVAWMAKYLVDRQTDLERLAAEIEAAGGRDQWRAALLARAKAAFGERTALREGKFVHVLARSGCAEGPSQPADAGGPAPAAPAPDPWAEGSDET